jgi:hypothetical protein
MNPARCLLLVAVWLSSACSDGGGTIATPTVAVVDPLAEVGTATTDATVVRVESATLHYPSGRVLASGDVIAGTTKRTGIWTTYFDDESGRRQWEGTYRDGEVDRSQPWQEWNRDGSVRFDSTDQ